MSNAGYFRRNLLVRARLAAVEEPSFEIREAERHVREGEDRVRQQLGLVRRLEAAGRHADGRKARELLGTLTEALDTAKRTLQIVRRAAK